MVRLTDSLDMTIAIDWDVKPLVNQINVILPLFENMNAMPLKMDVLQIKLEFFFPSSYNLHRHLVL